MLAVTPPRRDFSGLERRREQAARLFACGKVSQAEVARELKVSRQSVSRWYQSWRRRGKSGLAGAGRAGRKSRLTQRQWSASIRHSVKDLEPMALKPTYGPFRECPR